MGSERWIGATVVVMAALGLGAPCGAQAQPARPFGAAPAQPAPGPGDAAADEADAHFRRGNDLYKAQRWADAEAAYEEAFARKKAHDVAANLAYAEMKQGKHREAAEHLAFAVRNWAPTGKEDKRKYAEERLAQVKKEVGALKVRVNVAGAEVLVDGAAVGRSPLESEIFVAPGAHAVEARRAGYRETRQEVQAGKGAEVEVALEMVALPEAVAGARADAGAGAGARADAGAVAGAGADAGAGAGAEAEAAGPRKALLIAGGATAGAALVAGVIFAVVANGKAGERDAIAGWERCYAAGPAEGLPDCARVDDLRHGAADFGNAAFWSFVGAGVIGGATVAYGVLASRRAPPSQGVRVLPVASAEGAGLWLSGRW